MKRTVFSYEISEDRDIPCRRPPLRARVVRAGAGLSDELVGRGVRAAVRRCADRRGRGRRGRAALVLRRAAGKAAFLKKPVLSEFWVFQEKVDMKVSAFSFTTSLLVFGYL